MSDLSIELKEGKKIYFASDFHLGFAASTSDKEFNREKKIIRWLDSVETDAQAVFLVGDIFDFWFEYKHAVPKGFIRFLGKIASITDRGIPVYFFVGNHDLWMFDYFPKELNIKIFTHPIELQINNTSVLVGHGDGLGPGDNFYKLLKLVFTNHFARWVFRLIHPDLGIGLAKSWSKSSRLKKIGSDEVFLGEKEFLVQYCRKKESESHHDIYIFGHRHLPLNIEITKNSRYYNLGEWVHGCTYGVFDAEGFKLEKFKDNQ
jgi:UDP-2,3-diacylglucosamine hydrolase